MRYKRKVHPRQQIGSITSQPIGLVRLREIAAEARRRYEALEERRLAALDGAGFPPSPHEVIKAERLMVAAEMQAEAAARMASEA